MTNSVDPVQCMSCSAREGLTRYLLPQAPCSMKKYNEYKFKRLEGDVVRSEMSESCSPEPFMPKAQI